MSNSNPPGHPASATQPPASAYEMFDFYVAQLEAYLDGELEPGEAHAVRERLRLEPAYAAALERLHSERQTRVCAFEAIEQDEVDDRAAERLRIAARQISLRTRAHESAQPWHRQVRWLKLASGMAACVLVGFGIAWMGGLDMGQPPAEPQGAGHPPAFEIGNNRGTLVLYNKEGEVVMETPLEETIFNRPLQDPMRDPRFVPHDPLQEARPR